MGALELLPLTPLETLAWSVQAAWILWWAWRGRRDPITWPTPSWTACALVVALAWVWRLAHLFALASGGLDYWSGDEPTRWLQAWSFADGIPLRGPDPGWMPAIAVTHGLAMRLVDDPLVASKLVSAITTALPLLGVFVFSLAVFRDRVVACATVVFAAPGWIETLLGAGPMADGPVVGLVLGGVGLAVPALDGRGGRRRGSLLAGAAACFAAATAYHAAAWIMLAAIGPALAIAWLRTAAADRPGAGAFVAFALASGGFCALWLARAWWETGDPLAPATRAAGGRLFKLGVPMRAEAGIDPGQLAFNLAIYPRALLYALRGFLPLAAFGVVRTALLRRGPGEPRDAARAVLLGGAAVLAALALTAAIGGANISPYRTVLPIAAALVPFALAPFVRERRSTPVDAPSPRRRLRPGPRAAGVALLVAVFALRAAEGHRGALAHPDAPLGVTPPGRGLPDTEAVGRWLRAERFAPSSLDARSLSLPIVLYVPTTGLDWVTSWTMLEYQIGDPRWTAPYPVAQGTPVEAFVPAMEPGQLLVAETRVDHPRLRPLAVFGRYHVYVAADRTHTGAPPARPRGEAAR